MSDLIAYGYHPVQVLITGTSQKRGIEKAPVKPLGDTGKDRAAFAACLIYERRQKERVVSS